MLAQASSLFGLKQQLSLGPKEEYSKYNLRTFATKKEQRECERFIHSLTHIRFSHSQAGGSQLVAQYIFRGNLAAKSRITKAIA